MITPVKKRTCSVRSLGIYDPMYKAERDTDIEIKHTDTKREGRWDELGYWD